MQGYIVLIIAIIGEVFGSSMLKAWHRTVLKEYYPSLE
jgi:hypothetical protein